MIKRRAGFTLLEVLLAAGLAAVISAAVLVPIVYSLSSLENAQYEFGRESDSDFTAAGIFRELRASTPEAPFPVLKTEYKESLAVKEDGRLMLWTSAISKSGLPAGGIAYRIIKEGDSSGLYRWILKPGEAASEEDGETEISSVPGPLDRDTETLDKKDGKLVIRNAEGITFEASDGKKWLKEYSGNMPAAFRISVYAGGKRRIYEEALPLSR